jgi:hypothetical protein
MNETQEYWQEPIVQQRVLKEYLQVMIARRDWHGVADVAMDLRDMEAEQRARDNN